MPIAVDVEQRLRDIAQATLEVAASRGVDGVTIRAVASQLGGSTTVVTNYLPTRSALLRNASDHALRNWEDDLRAQLAGVDDEDRFAAIARWSCATTGNDAIVRRLFVEMLARPGSDPAFSEALRADGRDHHATLHDGAVDAGAPDPSFAADVLYLTLRGFYLSTLEDAERWTSERVTPTIERLVGLLTAK